MLRSLSIFVLIFLVSCSSDDVAPKMPLKEVSVVLVEKSSISQTVENFAHIRAYYSATITGQVTGVLDEVHFKEGSKVNKGDLLFTIDPSTYKVNLETAKAVHKQSLANLSYAEQTVKRYSSLVNEDYVAKLVYEKYLRDEATAQADVEKSKAAIDQAIINLDYCKVRAPFTGLTGERLLDPGNLVSTDRTALVLINKLQPIYVDFPVSERWLSMIRKHQDEKALELTVSSDAVGGDSTYTGKLVMINNEVNLSSGTVSLRGELANEDLSLWPGQYVRVTLKVRTINDVLVIPQDAVQLGNQGHYVIVVTEKGIAEIRPITVDLTASGKAVIKEGLQEGEQVISTGVIAVRPGSQVKIRSDA